jgi:kynurenine formamidase
MILTLNLGSVVYCFDTDKPYDLSIAQNFNDAQPNAFNVPKAASEPVLSGSFIGDTRKGGSCNVEQIKMIPHCNGTHTECVGHISNDRIHINDILSASFWLADLISIQPVSARETKESYSPDMNPEDELITYSSLMNAFAGSADLMSESLIIRTLPNDESKLFRNYADEQPPYFTIEAMEYISRMKIKHLLVDIPSVDRTMDEGKLTAHHIFWNVQRGTNDVSRSECSLNTITEMIYVPDSVKDGLYMLDLQVSNFSSDAAPSKPVIYEILKLIS